MLLVLLSSLGFITILIFALFLALSVTFPNVVKEDNEEYYDTFVHNE